MNEYFGEGRILHMTDWYQLRKDDLQVECTADISKIDLIEVLAVKVSVIDKDTTNIELQLAKFEVEKKRLRQRVAQEAAMLKLDREHINTNLSFAKKKLNKRE